MKKFLYITVALIIISTITVFSIGPLNVMLYFLEPNVSFTEDIRAEEPDYSNELFWAALPDKTDLSDMVPEGIEQDTLLHSVDVFFIHPTGYLKGKHWNSLMDANTATEENTLWMMANQASTFSDCSIYAPRYREATIYSFFDVEGEDEKAALDLAYQDVEKAFDYYLENYNHGRPFIIASHSQGSYHALPLIKNKIDNSPLADQLVAAYIVGMSTITTEAVADLKTISICNQADQTNCLIHWATFAEGSPRTEDWGKTMVCVNPISWQVGQERADQSLHQGFVPSTGTYNLEFYGDDKAQGITFKPLESPQPSHTRATCFEGRLLVEKQNTPALLMGEGNYHGLDYQLFHMDIRKNVALRVKSYLDSKSAPL